MDETATTVAAVNAFDPEDFVERFGDVAEHAPWVAEEAARWRPFADRDAMVAAFCDAIDAAGTARQRDLLIAHPDLAGRAAIAGGLTADSAREQAGAGRVARTPDEFERFADLNERYREKFGIPFIFAVRGATKHDILRAYEERVGRDQETEFEAALGQVKRIVRFRLEDRVSG